MPNEWTEKELKVSTIAYMWMRRSSMAGFQPVKSRVRKALISDALSQRSEGSLEQRFQNISAVLEEMGIPWLQGYPPKRNVGPGPSSVIKEAVEGYLNGPKHAKRISELVRALNPKVVSQAAKELAAGADFKFPESTTYDVVMGDGTRLAPKAVIGYAGLLQYGAPLLSVDFTGGEDSFGFGRLEEAGLIILTKDEDTHVESEKFRSQVLKLKKNGMKSMPEGNLTPQRKTAVSYTFERSAEVVAYVEARANGICELCDKPAPFTRSNGEPFLEVHHIRPLSEDGADTVENAAALCPNCHRECHHGNNALSIREPLLEKITAKQIH